MKMLWSDAILLATGLKKISPLLDFQGTASLNSHRNNHASWKFAGGDVNFFPKLCFALFMGPFNIKHHHRTYCSEARIILLSMGSTGSSAILRPT